MRSDSQAIVMNLKSIRLAGFKSFADITTIPLPGNLTAIVGPNGCGKSNIVDAVRWVIGESSAKQLRGEQLSDVIFSGSSQRKPQGQASIELLFDNSQGKFGGEYARYSEIAIRREITREGQSQFYLNGTRCRRRDITDLFLGTGLGPHSYAIIEQGVISKLIEGKPEDMRTYLEEAAGTSKYRERRRETENRLQNTRENLERLMDLRLEIEKQLEHLKRQASDAQRYKALKQDERLTKAQLHALHAQALNRQLTEQQNLLEECTTQIEAKKAEHSRIELDIERHRVLQSQTNETFHQVQATYYQLGADIGRQEQQIQYIHTQKQQLTDDLAKITEAQQESEQQLTEDHVRIEALINALESLEPECEQAKQAAEQALQALQAIEKERHNYLAEWERFHLKANQAHRQADAEKTRVHHAEQKIADLAEHIQQLEEQRLALSPHELTAEIQTLSTQSTELKQQLDDVQKILEDLNKRILQQQQTNRDLQQIQEQSRKTLNQQENQKTSLETLQKAALGKYHDSADEWLTVQGWEERPRLLEGLTVEKGWETAVETVLSPYLEAICTQDMNDFQMAVEKFSEGKLVVFYGVSEDIGHKIEDGNQSLCHASEGWHPEKIKLQPLLSKIQCSYPIAHLLANVYTASDASHALASLPKLQSHESIITPEGLWMSPSWLRISKIQDETTGVLLRKKALEDIEAVISASQQTLQEKEQACEQGRIALAALEQKRDANQQQFRELSMQYNEAHARFSAQQARLAQLQRQEATLAQDLIKFVQQKTMAESDLQTARLNSEKALQEQQPLEAQKTALNDKKQTLEANYQSTRAQFQSCKQTADEYQVRLSTTQGEVHYLRQNIQRAEKQLTQLQERHASILKRQTDIEQPLPEWQAALQQLLENRVSVEKELTLHKQSLSQLEDERHHHEKQRNQVEKELQSIRQQQEDMRIAQTSLQTYLENHLAQIQEAGYEMNHLEMPAEATVEERQQQLQRLENRIQRLGPINLAAIEEYEKMAERKQYLDNQDNDLKEAIATLEESIHKIDKESRARLRETFEKANAYFKELFTSMFGGGHAELEWVGDEVLNAGVAIRAQPPGKRNALLHLLSGGEKALTAIALVFALFQLNPAPFCILDEVDAPLDEANIGRFCRLVKTMANTVQFLFISHNKATMEMAQQMIGVTMQEPGVSRLVSVDMEEAIAMAAAS